MIKIERTATPPPSLAQESEKPNGSYRGDDVIEQLVKDFHGKCYICELDEITDINVEHLRPHYNRKYIDRVFDWNNLFLSCIHCNSIKNNSKYDDKILDCCNIDPEHYLNHEYINNTVRIFPCKNDCSDESILMTADLIESCFEKRNTGIRMAQCNARVKRLAETMNILYKVLESFKRNRSSHKCLGALRSMLSRKYKFSAFTRYYVRQHLTDYPELEQLIS